MHGEIDKLVGQAAGHARPGQPAAGARSSAPTDHADFADCDFVIEAVFEELSIKKQVFADRWRSTSPPTCVLATNTSSLSVTEMAADLAHPERVVGFHFFNPVVGAAAAGGGPRRARPTTPPLATALAVAKQLKKNAVLVNDAPAFVVNRLLIRVMGEIIEAVDEGTPVPVADAGAAPARPADAARSCCCSWSGPPIVLHVAETLHAAFGDRFPVSANLRALVAAGRSGHLRLDRRTARPYVSEETAGPVHRRRPRRAPRSRSGTGRWTALAEEIGLMLAEGVVAAPMDIDLCLILGAGWPFHLGRDHPVPGPGGRLRAGARPPVPA